MDDWGRWGLKRVRDGRRERQTERKTAGWGLWRCIMHCRSSARVACWCQGCHSCFTLCGDGLVAMAAAKQLISKYYRRPVERESRALTLTDSRHQIIGLLLTDGGTSKCEKLVLDHIYNVSNTFNSRSSSSVFHWSPWFLLILLKTFEKDSQMHKKNSVLKEVSDISLSSWSF